MGYCRSALSSVTDKEMRRRQQYTHGKIKNFDLQEVEVEILF